jgi:hypothetical protein
MRWLGTLGLVTVSLVAASAQDPGALPAKRYGVYVDLRRYPQGAPKETLASVLAAIDQKRFDYLIAHLADPDFVDERVKQLKGNFDEVVGEARMKYTDNPEAVKLLQRFLKEGEWEGGEGNTASVQLKDVKDRRVFFRKVDMRWYLENRQKAKAAG